MTRSRNGTPEEATEVLKQLAAPFPDADIRQDKQRPDGFKPNYIPWDKIVARLDEATGGNWDWTINKYEFNANQAIVQGTLEIGVGDMILRRDGVGCAELTVHNNAYTQMGDDLKAADTDALKRAAVKFGVGIQLYQREFNQRMLQQQAQQAQETLPAQPFQIDKVRQYLGQIDLPEVEFCTLARIPALSSLTNADVTTILAGHHPALQSRGGRPQAGRPTMRASNA